MKRLIDILRMVVSLALIYAPLIYVVAGFVAGAGEFMPDGASQAWRTPADGWIYATLALAFGTSGLIDVLRHSARKP